MDRIINENDMAEYREKLRVEAGSAKEREERIGDMSKSLFQILNTELRICCKIRNSHTFTYTYHIISLIMNLLHVLDTKERSSNL